MWKTSLIYKGEKPRTSVSKYSSLLLRVGLQRSAAAYKIIIFAPAQPSTSTGLRFAPSKVGIYNVQLNLKHIQHDLSQTDTWYMDDVCNVLTTAKAEARDGKLVLCPCKDCKNQRKQVKIESIRTHLITRESCQTIRYGVCMGRLVRMFCKKTMMMLPCLT